MIELKPCPFCGAKIEPYVFNNEDNPYYWRNGLWHLSNTHKKGCLFEYYDFMSGYHFGEAKNGEPTEALLNFIENWNTREPINKHCKVSHTLKENRWKIAEIAPNGKLAHAESLGMRKAHQ